MIAVDAESLKCHLRVVLLAVCSIGLAIPGFSQEAEDQADGEGAAAESSDIGITLGFDGMWKLGQACPVQVGLATDIAAKLERLEVATFDGDGVPVIYQFEPTEDNTTHQAVIRIGRADRNITVRAYGLEEKLLAEKTYFPEQLPPALPSSQPFVVALGSTMGVEELARKTTDAGSTLSTVAIESAEQLPNSWRAYTACDLIVISTANLSLLEEIDQAQWRAILDWIDRGGGAVISIASEDAAKLEALQELLPSQVEESVLISNPASLETLVSTKQRLDDFEAVRFAEPSGSVKLYLTDSLSKRIPWWISYVRGRGTLRLIASDLDTPAFAEWPDRRALWERILVSYLDRRVFDPSAKEEVATNVSYLGYRDMVGQLRAMLDVFAGVTVLSFSQIAAMVIGVLLLIGPLDYLISVKWLKKPELSWYVAGVLLLAISTGLTFLYLQLRPNEVIVNSAQVIDVDVTTGDVDGRLWAHVYSGRAKRFDVDVSSTLGGGEVSKVYLDWQGLPGSGLGGLQSQLDVDRGMPGYKVIEREEGSRFEGVGIPTAGSKSLFGSWKQSIEISGQSKLQETDGVDQVQGELVNPLPFELKEPMLFYHGWYYLLNSRLRPGEAISISFDMIPKDLKRRLNGRIRGKEGIDTAKAWDPAERENIDRLLEVMMFYKAASGSNYTALENRYQPQVDQSNLIELDRAILVGKYGGDDMPVEFTVSESGSASGGKDPGFTVGKSTTWVRVAIPVARPEK